MPSIPLDGSLIEPTYNFIFETNTGFYRPSTGKIGVAISGSQKAYFDSSGLAVSGIINASGEIRNTGSASDSPYTQQKITVYRESNGWAYFGYGSDSQMRIIFDKTGQGHSLLFGTSSNVDNNGTYTNVMSLSSTTLTVPSLTSSGIVATDSYIRVKGSDSSPVASSGVLDFSGGITRLISRGANTNTNGAFQLISTRSDGTNAITALTVDTDGTVNLVAKMVFDGLIVGTSGSSDVKVIRTDDYEITFDSSPIAGTPITTIIGNPNDTESVFTVNGYGNFKNTITGYGALTLNSATANIYANAVNGFLAINLQRTAANAGVAFYINSNNSVNSLTTRFTLSSGTNIATATWSNIYHTGLELSGDLYIRNGINIYFRNNDNLSVTSLITADSSNIFTLTAANTLLTQSQGSTIIKTFNKPCQLQVSLS